LSTLRRVTAAPPLAASAAPLRSLQLQQLKEVRDLCQTTFAQITPHAHAAQVPFWLTRVGFTQHVHNCNSRLFWALHALAPSPLAVPFITPQEEAGLQVFGKTMSVLMHRLYKWATPFYRLQRCSHKDVRLLKSFNQELLNPWLFKIPFTANQYVQEWVRCCLYVV
jgi:hypothetical protein